MQTLSVLFPTNRFNVAQLRSLPKYLAIATAVVVATACATLDPQAVQTQTRGKSIAVVSALGSNLSLKWVATAFTSEEGEIPVPAWEIDEMATKTVSTMLLATQRYSTVTVYKGISRVENAVPQLPTGAQADYLLLIERHTRGNPDPMFGSSDSFGGLGIAQRSLLGMVLPRKAHVGISIELFDLTAGKSMGSVNEFEHWPTTVELKSGGGFNWKSDKNPVPRIDGRDLAELQQPITTRLVKVVEGLIGKMGLLR